MGATTPGQLPYPEPTDPVAAGAAAIRSLAEAVDPHLFHVFTTTADRDTKWPAAPNGSICLTADTATVWTRKGGAWIPAAGVLPAAVYTKADQAIGTGGVSALGFTAATVQQGGIALEAVGSANVILPFQGVYLVTLNVAWSVNVTGIRSCSISNPATGFNYAETAGPASNAVNQVCTTIQKFNAGDKVRGTVFQNSGATINALGLSGTGNNTQISVHMLGQLL